MVQRINNKTMYRCHICKKIYTSMKRALECEENCLDEENYEYKPVQGIIKLNGKKKKIILNYRIRKFTEIDKKIFDSIGKFYTNDTTQKRRNVK